MLRYKIIAFLALFVGLAAAQQKVMPSTYTAFTESPYPETSANQQKNLASDYIIYKGSMQPLKYTELIRSGGSALSWEDRLFPLHRPLSAWVSAGNVLRIESGRPDPSEGLHVLTAEIAQ